MYELHLNLVEYLVDLDHGSSLCLPLSMYRLLRSLTTKSRVQRSDLHAPEVEFDPCYVEISVIMGSDGTEYCDRRVFFGLGPVVGELIQVRSGQALTGTRNSDSRS